MVTVEYICLYPFVSCAENIYGRPRHESTRFGSNLELGHPPEVVSPPWECYGPIKKWTRSEVCFTASCLGRCKICDGRTSEIKTTRALVHYLIHNKRFTGMVHHKTLCHLILILLIFCMSNAKLYI